MTEQKVKHRHVLKIGGLFFIETMINNDLGTSNSTKEQLVLSSLGIGE
jgi:hypothetical protein